MRPEVSSFKIFASSDSSMGVLKPAYTVKPKSSNFLAKYQAMGLSQPVIKTPLPEAETCELN